MLGLNGFGRSAKVNGIMDVASSDCACYTGIATLVNGVCKCVGSSPRAKRFISSGVPNNIYPYNSIIKAPVGVSYNPTTGALAVDALPVSLTGSTTGTVMEFVLAHKLLIGAVVAAGAYMVVKKTKKRRSNAR